MNDAAEKIRAQLASFDPDEVRRKMAEAEVRLKFENEYLPEIQRRYCIDPNTALVILDETLVEGGSEERILTTLHEIAASWVGESRARVDAAKRVDARLGEKMTSLRSAMVSISEAMAGVAASGVLPSRSA
jgi:hypothetical protein